MHLGAHRNLLTPGRRGTPAAMSISPPNVGDVVGWYESEGISIGAITTWSDSGAFANHITQATGSKKPVGVDRQLDGRKVARFAGDGNVDSLANAAPTLSAPTGITMHVVAKLTSLAVSYPMMLVGFAGQSELRFFDVAEQPQALADHLGVDTAQPSASPGTYLNKWHQYTLTFDPTTNVLVIYVDGVAANTNPSADGNLAFNVIRMGSRDDTTNLFTGDIAEALLYRTVQSSGDVDGLCDQLRLKFPSLP